MGSTIKGKNLLPMGANSFFLESTPFQKVYGMQESIQEVAEVVSLMKNGGKSTKFIQSPKQSLTLKLHL